MLNLEKSERAFAAAQNLMPGGVNSPVRSYQNVDCNPPFIAKGKGSKIYDIDGNEYIDYVGSWGPLILGHAAPVVVEALKNAVAKGTSYGAPTLLESELAELVMKLMPNIEMIRMVNSGTEATMSALRLARGYTKRDKIVKFIGCYHGHHDALLVRGGSGMVTFGEPDSPGVPKAAAGDTLTVPYNDKESFAALMEKYGEEIAAVIVEPVAGNMGLVLPKEEFLQALRQQTKKYGSVLIFDEVMCGFRTALRGAQSFYGIKPDLTCLGKIIGGGLPAAAYGGRREIMEQMAPAGPVYQAGTLAGNPLAMTAGIATLQQLLLQSPNPGKDDFCTRLAVRAEVLADGLRDVAAESGVAVQVHQSGSMLGLFFAEHEVYDYETAAAADKNAFKVYFQSMLESGIYLPPSPFETFFFSAAHTDVDVARTLQAAKKAFKKVRAGRK